MGNTVQLQKNIMILLVFFYFGLKCVSTRSLCGRQRAGKGTCYRSNAPLGLLVGLWSFHIYNGLSENF